MPRPLYISRPMLPDQDEFTTMVRDVWHSRVLSSGSPFHERLELDSRAYLDVPTAMLFNNGAIALLCILKMFSLPPGSESSRRR